MKKTLLALSESSQTARSLSSNAQDTENQKGLIIFDLRGNVGGSLEPALNLAALFLKAGQRLLQLRKRHETLVIEKKVDQGKMKQCQHADAASHEDQNSDNYRQEHIVAIIDKCSASATEAFVIALQDNNRATVIGETSKGKNIAQVKSRTKLQSLLILLLLISVLNFFMILFLTNKPNQTKLNQTKPIYF